MSSGENRHAKSVHTTRNNISGKHKSLMKNRPSFDDNEAAKAVSEIGSTMAALDRYLSTVIGTPAARAALDVWKFESRNARAAWST